MMGDEGRSENLQNCLKSIKNRTKISHTSDESNENNTHTHEKHYLKI